MRSRRPMREAPVLEPGSVVFAAVTCGTTRLNAAEADERARAELDRRYPAGSAGLRVSFLRRGRRLLCYGVPRTAAGQAVWWTAFIPPSLRLRPWAVVLRRGRDGTLGVACLRWGTPVSVEARSLGDTVDPTLQAALGSLPDGCARAPRYALDGGFESQYHDLRPVRSRRHPTGYPALAGRAPPRGLRRLIVWNLAAAAALAVVLVLGAGVEAGATTVTPAAGTAAGSAGPGPGPGPAAAPPAGTRDGGRAASIVGSFASAMAAAQVDCRIAEVRVEEATVVVRGTGCPAEAVRDAISGDAGFDSVAIVSSRGDEGFEVEAMWNTAAPAAGDARRSREVSKQPSVAAGPLVARELRAAGSAGVVYERAGGAGGYRVTARGSPQRTAQAVAALAGIEPEIKTRILRLTRSPNGSWELGALVASAGTGGMR